MIIGIDASRAEHQERTGTEWYSYELIRALQKVDKENSYILYSRKPLPADLAGDNPNFKNKPLDWVFVLLWTQIRLSWEVFWHPPDILLVPAHTVPIFRRCKAVVMIHDVGFDANPELYSFKDKLYHRFSVWYASLFAEGILCPSEFTKQELIKHYGTDPEKITVVHHGFRMHTAKQKISAEKYFLYVGRLEKKKNILRILQAFKKATDNDQEYKLVLAGRPGHGFAEFEEFVSKNNLSGRVKFPGYISDSTLSELFAGATAFVFPSLYEGFGLPILEAQSMSCPVITSKNLSTEEVAGDSALLVDPRSVDDIANQMDLVMRDEKLRKEIVEKGRENLKRFSWEVAAKKSLSELEKTLTRN